MDEESSLTSEMLDIGCQCPSGHPPCSFCTSLNEEEAEIYANGGMQALREHFYTESIEDYNIW